MKCKQCGAEINNEKVCLYCGSKNVEYDEFSDSLRQDKGEQIRYQSYEIEYYESSKNKMITFLLALISGPLGLHNLYVGKWGRALLYFMTCAFFMVGWVYDLYKIATGKFQDANGDYIVR